MNKQGFTLIEILIAMAITTVSVLALSQVFINLVKTKQQADFMLGLSQIRINLQQPIMRSPDWNVTVSKNSGMSCFSGSVASSCLSQSQASGAPWPLTLYNAAGQVVYDSNQTSSGFTQSGEACANYGVFPCVLKPNLVWQLQCNTSVDANCMSPLVIIDLTFNYTGPDIGAIDYNSFGFHLTHGTFPITQAQVCTGVIPICTGSQQPVCVSDVWQCEEFGQ
jgi:prepilin-type N-terminal cleavage/methylation domain-containing protein